jgi:hypothetical protein
MNKIQTKSNDKILRKRRIRATALAELAASKIPHSKHSDHARFAYPGGGRRRRLLSIPGVAKQSLTDSW